MATYKALAKGHDGKRIIEIGETFVFNGIPGTWMKPICDEAKEKSAAYMKSKGLKPFADKVEEALEEEGEESGESTPAPKKGKGK